MKALGKNYNDAEASGSFERLPAGGYVCRIKSVKDCPKGFKAGEPDKGDYIEVVFDIAEGQYKGFYSDDWGQKHPFAHQFVMSYKETAFGMFKGRLKAIDESNGTDFVSAAVKGLDEQQLVGKLVGLVIGYEEYISDRGEVRQRAYVKEVRSVDKIRSGDFRTPDVKPIEESKAPKAEDPRDDFSPLGEEDFPF